MGKRGECAALMQAASAIAPGSRPSNGSTAPAVRDPDRPVFVGAHRCYEMASLLRFGASTYSDHRRHGLPRSHEARGTDRCQSESRLFDGRASGAGPLANLMEHRRTDPISDCRRRWTYAQCQGRLLNQPSGKTLPGRCLLAGHGAHRDAYPAGAEVGRAGFPREQALAGGCSACCAGGSSRTVERRSWVFGPMDRRRQPMTSRSARLETRAVPARAWRHSPPAPPRTNSWRRRSAIVSTRGEFDPWSTLPRGGMRACDRELPPAPDRRVNACLKRGGSRRWLSHATGEEAGRSAPNFRPRQKRHGWPGDATVIDKVPVKDLRRPCGPTASDATASPKGFGAERCSITCNEMATSAGSPALPVGPSASRRQSKIYPHSSTVHGAVLGQRLEANC